MSMRDKRLNVLVTGGAGFIGSHLVEGLLERGDSVKVLDNFSSGKRANLTNLGNGRWSVGRDFEVIEADIRDFSAVDRASCGMDAIFHCAALASVPRSIADPVAAQEVNADGTLNIFLAARDRGVSRVVFASSSAVYGNSTRQPKREGEEGNPLSPYALTKEINEHHGRLFANLYGFETIGLRYSNVYGPRQDPESEYAAVIPRFLTALLAGNPPTIYGTGEQTRDFVYIEDVVEANFLALEAPSESCGASYNVGYGEGSDLWGLLGILQDLLETDIEPLREPPRPGDIMHSSADPSLALKRLGFSAQCSLGTGLEKAIGWYRSNFGARSVCCSEPLGREFGT
jgi:nucleoside-diphosphate-sugar epimerase